MMLSQDVGQKRKRFTSSDITLSRNNGSGDSEGNELTAVIRKWGSAFTVFEGTDRDTPLWQLQICHGGRNSFGYQVLAVAREALQKHPNSGVRDLQQLESVLQVRVLNGAPPQSGPMDPDGIGLEAWQVVLYATSVSTALDFIELVLSHKVAKGHLLQLPSLHVACPDGTLDAVPQPWKSSHFPLHGPKAFAALPPKGRRHILCLVELRQAATRTTSSKILGQQTRRSWTSELTTTQRPCTHSAYSEQYTRTGSSSTLPTSPVDTSNSRTAIATMCATWRCTTTTEARTR